MQVFKVFEKSWIVWKSEESLKKSLNSLVIIWLYDFLANKIDWLKQDFCKYQRKSAF
jgi:hypothetical protein